MTEAQAPWIGVVVVAYAAEDFIHECLESLVCAGYDRLKIIVVDNDSPDQTPAAVRGWASGEVPFAPPDDWPLPPRPAAPKPRRFAEMDAAAALSATFEALGEVTLVHSGANLGFAGGVNVGLRTLRAHPEIDLFWILNPDGVVEPGTPAAFAAAARNAGRFALIGGRVLYYGKPDIIQSDGGRLRWWIGFGSSVNQGRRAEACAAPDGATLDYAPGANMLASRVFLDAAGLMDESWFLYAEEVDWALRRGDLPLISAAGARIRHRAGASIGSQRLDRLEGPFSVYFSQLNHLRLAARWNALRLPFAYAAALLVILRKYVRAGAWAQARAGLAGLHGFGPPPEVRRRLPPEIWAQIAARARW